MKKRSKWIVALVGLAAVAIVATYLFTRENPDYINAAKGLDQAKKDAIQAFGTLTWEQYRAERGIKTRDDTEAWERIGKTVPRAVSEYRFPDPGDTGLKTAFLADREWFVTIRNGIDGLTIQHVHDSVSKQWSRGPSLAISSLRYALFFGVIGAADAGDLEAVRKISQAWWSLAEKGLSEPDWIAYMSAKARNQVFELSLLVAAVRNRQNLELLDEIRNSVPDWPQLPTLAVAFAGDVRNESLRLDELRALDPEEIDQWLDDYLLQVQISDELFSAPGSIGEEIERDVSNTLERARNVFRGTGPHTSDALEARHWETAIEFYDALNAYDGDRLATRKQAFSVQYYLDRQSGVSYELAQLLNPINFQVADTMLRFGGRDSFATDTRRTAIEMVWRFPEYDSLPEQLPQDLLFADPYGGDVLYRKTKAGFVLYSRGKDGVDDGLVPDTPDQFRMRDVMSIAVNNADVGLVICYDPIIP